MPGVGQRFEGADQCRTIIVARQSRDPRRVQQVQLEMVGSRRPMRFDGRRNQGRGDLSPAA